MDKDELDISNPDNEFLKNFNKKVKKKHKEMFEKPDVKPKEVFENWKDKPKSKNKKSKKNN